MNEKILNKYCIRIPKTISVLYCKKKKIITIIGPLNTKSIKLKLKIEILNNINTIYVTSTPVASLTNKDKKNIKSLRGTILALIKQLILETSTVLYKKLKFVGVGYKVFYTNNLDKKLLLFKLGFSHFIYFKVPDDLKTFCLKQTKLFLFGTSFPNLTKTASIIQSCKFPDPYKGKGILYENEKIKLKEGKKHK